MKDIFKKEVGRAMERICEENDSEARDAHLRGAFNATQCTGIHKKSVQSCPLTDKTKTSAWETIAAALNNASGIRACAYGGDVGATGDIFFQKRLYRPNS